jgi:YD repeat-containing protein
MLRTFFDITRTPSSTSYYNGLGQLTNQTDPDGVVMLYGYDDQGRRILTVTNLIAVVK